MTCAPKRTCKGRPIVCPGPCNPRHRTEHRKPLADKNLGQEGVSFPEVPEQETASRSVGQVTSFREDKFGSSNHDVSVTELTSIAEFTMIGVSSVARTALVDQQTSTGIEVPRPGTDNRDSMSIPQFRIIGVPQSGPGLTGDSGARPILLPYRVIGQSNVAPNHQTHGMNLDRSTPSTAILIIAPISRKESSSMSVSSLDQSRETRCQEVSADQGIPDLRSVQESAVISAGHSFVRSGIPEQEVPGVTGEDPSTSVAHEESFGGVLMVAAHRQEIRIAGRVPTCGRIPCVNRLACKMAAEYARTNVKGSKGKLSCLLSYLIVAIIYTSFHGLLALLAWENPTYEIFLSSQICGLLAFVACGITGYRTT